MQWAWGKPRWSTAREWRAPLEPRPLQLARSHWIMALQLQVGLAAAPCPQPRIANVAMQAPAFATRAAKTAHYFAVHAGMTFEDLMHLVEQAPKAPMLENPKRRRSSTPDKYMLKDAAAPEAASQRVMPAHDTELLRFPTVEEWAKKPKGTLVDQLYKRDGFAEALGIKHSKSNLGKIFRTKTNAQLAQLIIALDAKSG